jgi:hypothetical protein
VNPLEDTREFQQTLAQMLQDAAQWDDTQEKQHQELRSAQEKWHVVGIASKGVHEGLWEAAQNAVKRRRRFQHVGPAPAGMYPKLPSAKF